MKSFIKNKIISFFSVCFGVVLLIVNFLKVDSIIKLIRLGIWRAKKLTFGKETAIYNDVVIYHPERVVIGSHVAIAEFVHIWGRGGVEIGDNTLVASHCVITSQTHNFERELYRKTLECKPVIIGKNVWIGAGAIILPGVRIGNDSVVGAGSVVTRNVPERCVVAGVPAKLLRQLSS